MSSSVRKPLSNATNSVSARRIAGENNSTKASAASTVPTSTGQGLARSPSYRQTRPTRKPANRTSNSFSADTSGEDNDSKASNAQLIAELKEQVEKAELASEHYQKQLEILQVRFDEISAQQIAVEEKELHNATKIDELEAHLKDSARQQRELEQNYEADKALILQDRDRRISKEAELQAIIQRLNDTIRQKDRDRLSVNRSANTQGSIGMAEEAPMAQMNQVGNASGENNEVLIQKDQMIDALRLELVEAQIKLTEIDHLGDGRLQQLEKALMETKMANARLTEDNESFQYLLSEKTLKGDFMHDTSVIEKSAGLSSLAEELESAADDPGSQSETYKKLEAENKSLRDGNKALTLYVDKIIGRILQHEGFEHIITGKDESAAPPVKPAVVEKVDKALPATPDQGAQPTFLQRARSVVQRPTAPRARPQSIIAPPTANENPETAPSIPLTRGHRRARSDQTQADIPGAAAVVQQMNRGSPLRTVSGGAMSPGLGPQLNSNRTSYFYTGPPPAGRTPSAGTASAGEKGSSANSVTSDLSGEKDSTDASSAQTSSHGASNIPGAVMKQNQLRPLRLVREQAQHEDNEAQKRANRGSWMGWFKGATLEGQNDFAGP